MDTMEDSEVVVILKGLHPSGLLDSQDTPVIYHQRIGVEGHEWLAKICTVYIQ